MSDSTPRQVREAFERVRAEYPFYVSLKKIDGHYYVYRMSSKWERGEGRSRSVSEYLGRISDTGEYVKTASNPDKKLERAKAVIYANGGMVVWKGDGGIPAPDTFAYPEGKELRVDRTEESVLRSLSMNSRLTMQELGELSGMDKNAAYGAVKRLERRFGVRYTPMIDVTPLGFSWFMGLVKFTGAKPSVSEIRAAFEGNPRVQLVALTAGEHDMLFIFCAENNSELTTLTYRARKRTDLRKYPAEWNIVPIEPVYDSIPLRDVFFDLLKEKVWKRSKERPQPAANELTYSQFNVLRAINTNAEAGLAGIDRAYGLGAGSAHYTYERLMQKGIITRPTITMDRLPIKYHAVLFVDFLDLEAFERTRPELLYEVVSGDEAMPVNRYSFVANVHMPEGGVFIAPIMNDHQLRDIVTGLESKIKGVRVRESVITDTVIGSFFHRKHDRTHTRQARILAEEYGIDEFKRPKIDYKTGERTKEKQVIDFKKIEAEVAAD